MLLQDTSHTTTVNQTEDTTDDFYHSCCGKETFLGHADDCQHSVPAPARYRLILSRDFSAYSCRRCGLLVVDSRLHDKWHSEVE